jgi:tRNA (cmo5U34)-methyltransferase
MEHIKKHFDEEAEIYDDLILQIIPYYNEMITGLIEAIQFKRAEAINVIDLGCGTGTISKKIKESFPNANVTCIDIAPRMIETAKQKLADYDDITFKVGNFETTDFDKQYDVVVSSLAIHHLESDKQKENFFRKIFNSLNPNGVFYNADIVLASGEKVQEQYMKKWKMFMSRTYPYSEIEEKWIPTYRNEDRPSKLIYQLRWLREIGFEEVDVIWKYYNFAVYGGVKK